MHQQFKLQPESVPRLLNGGCVQVGEGGQGVAVGLGSGLESKSLSSCATSGKSFYLSKPSLPMGKSD